MTAPRTPIAPEGYEPVDGPVRCVGTLTARDGMVRAGDRVMASWQRFGYGEGNGTVVGFERHRETGWVKVVIDYDYPTDLSTGEDGFVRWDYDRTERVTGHWNGETQEESVGRWLAHLREQAEAKAGAS